MLVSGSRRGEKGNTTPLKTPAWEATGSTIVEQKITIERFHSRDQHLCKFIGTKESVYIKKKSSTPRGLIWNTNMATVSLFWNINMVAVTSRENALYFSTATFLCYCLSLSTLENIKLIIKNYFKSASRYVSVILLGIWCSLMTPDKALKWGPPKVLLTVHRHAVMQDALIVWVPQRCKFAA